MAYKPKKPFNVPLILLVPTSTTKINGVESKVYPSIADGTLIYGSFTTFGGTETTVNGIITIVDTADVETFYRPDIKANCEIALAGSNAIYEIISEPENIEMRNQFLKFKVRRTKGGA